MVAMIDLLVPVIVMKIDSGDSDDDGFESGGIICVGKCYDGINGANDWNDRINGVDNFDGVTFICQG